ncbi:MAG: hypothetical protein ACRD0U_07390, partial [Acidimicrobiales bacterium]
ACTNPSLGRGAAMALLHGCALRDLLREVSTDEPEKLAVRWDEVTEATVAPYYEATVVYDRHRLAEIDAGVRGVPFESDHPTSLAIRTLRAALPHDPDALRAHMSIASMHALPADVFANPATMARLSATAHGRPPYPLPGPSAKPWWRPRPADSQADLSCRGAAACC